MHVWGKDIPGRETEQEQRPPRGRGGASIKRMEAGWKDRLRTLLLKAVDAT